LRALLIQKGDFFAGWQPMGELIRADAKGSKPLSVQAVCSVKRTE
jgi:hypothetical protein